LEYVKPVHSTSQISLIGEVESCIVCIGLSLDTHGVRQGHANPLNVGCHGSKPGLNDQVVKKR
jgi:hypothetical protein